jgi:hypothetical protein
MTFYKVIVRYSVEDEVIVQASSPQEAKQIISDLDELEFENRDLISDYEFIEIEEI